MWTKLLVTFLMLLISLHGRCQKISFEDQVPTSFSAANKTELSVSDTYYKDGHKSLKWDFNSHSQIDVALPKTLTLTDKIKEQSGIYLWIYNEEPVTDSLTVEFLTPQHSVAYRFSFRLFSKGWRACWIGFKYMEKVCDTSSLSSYRFIAPERKGTLYLDRITFPVKKVNDRTTPDNQLPHNNSLTFRDLWHWCRVWQWEQYQHDFKLPSRLSFKQKEDLATVEKRLDNELQLKNLHQKEITKAYQTFRNASIRQSGKGFVGKPLVAPDELNKQAGELTWQNLEDMLAGFAYDALLNHSKTALKNYFLVWDYAINQGFAWGSGMGTNHHYGYQVRHIYTTAWLMRDYIYQSSNKDEILATLTFWSALQETRKPCQYGRDELLDSWHTLLQPKLIAAMIEPDACKQYRLMNELTRWLSTSLEYTPGTIGGIKVDGTTFHHGGFYPAYTTGVLAGIGLYIHLTDRTAFEPTDRAKQVLKSAFIAMRNYSNLHEWGIGISGRHPFKWKMKQEDIRSFAYLALAGDLSGKGDSIDYSLAADYMRLCTTNTPEKKYFEKLGIKPAKAPQGMFVYNYGATGIYRQNNWMVTLKGYNTDVWCSEIYIHDNRYGRYQSYGSVQIFNEQTRKESGYDENGWDWNRLPGTTTIHLPWELLDAPLKGTMMVHSHENFAGCSSFKNQYGIFAMKLMERKFQNFTPDFVARKSVFCFGKRLICLGSGISNSNATYPTETTLYQSTYSKGHPIFINGKELNEKGQHVSLTASNKKPVTLHDGYGNVYCLKDGKIHIQITNQESRHEKTRAVTHGTFASAWIDHGNSPQNDGYEYIVYIQPEKETLTTPFTSYQLRQKDNRAHIVVDQETGITAYVAFENLELNDDSILHYIPAETMVMQQVCNHTLTMSVCDPNLNIAEKTYTTKEPSSPILKEIHLKGRWEKVNEDTTEKIKLNIHANTTTLLVTCQHGIPVEFQLRKIENP